MFISHFFFKNTKYVFPYFFYLLSFTFCFIKPLFILRILILYMWYKYLFPKVGHLSCELVYVIFCQVPNFVLQRGIFPVFFLQGLWGSYLPLKSILTPKFIRILSTEVLRMEVPWNQSETGLGRSQVSSARQDSWQGPGEHVHQDCSTSLPKRPKGQRRANPPCQGSGGLAQFLEIPGFKDSLEFCFLFHNLLRCILL